MNNKKLNKEDMIAIVETFQTQRLISASAMHLFSDESKKGFAHQGFNPVCEALLDNGFLPHRKQPFPIPEDTLQCRPASSRTGRHPHGPYFPSDNPVPADLPVPDGTQILPAAASENEKAHGTAQNVWS